MDDNLSDSTYRLDYTYRLLDEFRKDNRNVYLHCKAGRSRSATVLIAYLMKTQGWTLDKAYEFARSKRAVVSPNIGFMSSLLKMDKLWNHKVQQQWQQQ